MFYRYLSNPEELNLDYRGHALLPPKKFFFPEVEVLFTYEVLDGDIALYDACEQLKGLRRIFIGIKPCDLKALQHLDKVFVSKFHDPYYKARREGTLIVALNCTDPLDYCFCAYVGSGPKAEGGYDLAMTDIGDAFLVDVGSEEGLKLVKLNLDLFRPALESDVRRGEERVKAARDRILRQGLPDLSKAYESFVRSFESPLWLKYSGKCLACGKCNYACPTCRCFDVYDDPSLDMRSGKRVRVWDSCHFLSFTRVAGGHVFRKERVSRFKQRVYHKYCYSLDEVGELSCVGCGRCVEVCPAGIDLREVLKEVVGGGEPVPA